MHVRFPHADEAYIKAKVDGGFYTTENEVVRDAIRRMREEDERIRRFQAAVSLGDADIAAGKSAPFDKKMVEEIKRKAMDGARKGSRKYNPDVIP